jgi:predicted lipase
LWVKNWWLSNGMIVDTIKGGNCISTNSKLTKAKIDSLSKEFNKFFNIELIRFGNLQPKINFLTSNSKKRFIKASIYEIENSNCKLLGQFIIEFGNGNHNKMKDIFNIKIIEPKNSICLPYKTLIELYNRSASDAEQNITPPLIEQN